MLTGGKAKLSTIAKTAEFYRTIIKAYGDRDTMTVFELYNESK
jgi:hypothetical protein